MTRRMIFAAITCAAITAALFKARTCGALTAHCPPDCCDCWGWRVPLRAERRDGVERRHEPYDPVRFTGTNDPDCCDCWGFRRHEPYDPVRFTGTNDPYCERLQSEAMMLRAAGR